MIDNSCAVLVHSCDKYSEAWELFFSLFFRAWEECPFQVYLSTEHNTFKDDKVRTINTGEGSWTRRLHKAIDSIDCKYIIILLEDFFLQASVNSIEIQRKIDCMNSNANIACFYFNRITGYKKESKQYIGYYEMVPGSNSRYMLNCQASLWNRSVLYQVTAQDCSPWEFEEYGYDNVIDAVKEKLFYCSINTYYDDIREGDVFSYILVRDKGYGIWNSKWLWNNKRLFRQCGLEHKNIKLGEIKWIDYQIMKLKNKLGKSEKM